MHGPLVLGSCDEAQLLKFINEVHTHRAAFQGMHQQHGELCQAYAARLKAKAELCQYGIKAPECGDELCTCLGHNMYRDFVYKVPGHFLRANNLPDRQRIRRNHLLGDLS